MKELVCAIVIHWCPYDPKPHVLTSHIWHLYVYRIFWCWRERFNRN